MLVLPHLGSFESINFTPADLQLQGHDLADEWPSRRRPIDMLFGQDLLWDIQDCRCAAVEGQPRLHAERTKLGLVIHGQYLSPKETQAARSCCYQEWF